MAKILRWYVSRISDIEGTAKKSSFLVDVTITPEARNTKNRLSVRDPQELTLLKSDNIEWWEPDEDYHVEGRTTAGALYHALTTRNVLQKSERFDTSSEERMIQEDMVFLQFVEDEKSFESVWDTLCKAKGLQKVDDLLDLPDSVWFDFTQQAREMSALIYEKALGEGEEAENETE